MISGLDTFRQITGYNIEGFFRRYQTFVAQNYQDIVDYYNGADRVARSFAALDDLNREVQMIEPLIALNNERFPTIDAWMIVDAYSDIFVALSTLNNMDKWARSSRTTQFDAQIRVDRTTSQGRTFETEIRDLGSNDFQNEWARITIENYIREEDYTSAGGTMFSVTLQNNANFALTNIVDNLQGLNVYGKDINRSFEFKDNDLQTVNFTDALRQTIDTILRTRKGSIPEFPEDGIEDAVIGTNVNTIQYPTIFRNILNIFRKDSRFVDVTLLDLFRQDDAVIMKLEITAILKDSFVTNLSI